MSLFPPPIEIAFEVWTSMPQALRRTGAPSDWARANKPGAPVDSFLEGPGFDRNGNLWVTDIPFGRVFRITADGDWQIVAEYDGWPNGLRFGPDGQVFLADYKRGILKLDPRSGTVSPVVTHRHSEGFRGCNDLIVAPGGDLYFTDQGQSGMHMPNGRVYRYSPESDRLDLLIDTCPSPNGLALAPGGNALYVAMTRGNSVWRLPFMADGSVSKAGVFLQLSGGLSGPDGMLVSENGDIFVAHPGLGCVWQFSELGVPKFRYTAPAGLLLTNLAFDGRGGLYATLSDRAEILRVVVER